jgi:glycyl-tRNA synthetase beta chain
MATLLLELFSEEIPSRMQRSGAEQLARLVTAGLDKAGLRASEVKSFVSPRHLAIQLFGLPEVTPDVREERKGPKIGAPEQAMAGFLKAVGLAPEQCEQRDGYYFATLEKKGQPVALVAKEIFESALNAFVWPKSMKWGARSMQWVRPLHRIVALLDSTVIPVQFGHLTAGNITGGHRFLSAGDITIPHAEAYEATLLAAHVMVDFAARKARIAEGVAAIAAKQSLALVDDDALLNEVTGLVEWPVPLLGSFDTHFLELPPEVLISEMKTHQRYFALTKSDGTLASQFITVANITPDDGGARIMDGNARVVRARLSDGAFYWEQDKKTSLADWGSKLADVVFHARVGMMHEKVARIEQLAVQIAAAVGYRNTTALQRAAQLAKADLTSGMVGEFPELQGIMGRYYALAQGETAEVADAIRDHYKPQGASDSLPASDLAAIIALADKLDSIISLFAAGEKPTGSKDPLALRRAALGCLRILLAQGWNLDLASFVSADVTDFFRDRLKTMLRDDGVRHDIIEASFAVSDGSFNPLAIVANARALSDFTAQQQSALAAIKRALSILAAEEKKAKTTYGFAAAKNAAFAKPTEQQLLAALQQNVVSLDALAGLAAPINQFFDDVLVTEEGHRDARLSLLAGVRECTQTIADFSKIEG